MRLYWGGARGLGRALAELFSGEVQTLSRSGPLSLDLAEEEAPQRFFEVLRAPLKSYDVIFYVAGGGPHGPYFSKPPQSHRWSWQVNAFTPLSIVKALIEKEYRGAFVYIGSAIAEHLTSNDSLSYAASKRYARQALLSLEGASVKTAVFSPPYMDTGHLPKNAWPRIECPEAVLSPEFVSEKILNWAGFPPTPEGPLKEQAFSPRHYDWILEDKSYEAVRR